VQITAFAVVVVMLAIEPALQTLARHTPPAGITRRTQT
jgi:hypothetical protein